jgi:S1-C subfamily serine protease
MMRENDDDHEGQPPEYVSPWAPQEPQEPPEPRQWQDPRPDDTIAFGNPPPRQSYPQPPSYGQPPDYSGAPDWGNWVPADGYGPPPPPRAGSGRRLLVYVAVAVVAASIGAGATVALNGNSTATPSGVSAHDIPAQHNNAAGSGSARASLNQTSVENRVEPGLVDITSTLKYNSETAEGTGMILSSDGLVLTNNHVIDQSTSVVATLVEGGRTYQAKVLGYDVTDDVALLKLQGASGLPVVSFGNSDQISLGTPVLALGNAQGRGGATPAQGIINALNRSIKASDQGSGGTENLQHMLQTSALIQQGDSGGALANNAGQVIGMITAANTTSGPGGGTTGFAIPVNTALAIAKQVAAGTASPAVYIGTPGFLGIILPQSASPDPQQQSIDEQQWLAQNNNGGGFGGGIGGRSGCIENNTQLTAPDRIAPARSGVLIAGAFCGTAVNDAGIVPGDVITSVNGQAVSTPDSLRSRTANYHPGSAVSIGWEDTSGGKHTTSITLGAGPAR